MQNPEPEDPEFHRLIKKYARVYEGDMDQASLWICDQGHLEPSLEWCRGAARPTADPACHAWVFQPSLWGCRPLRGRVKRKSLSNSFPHNCSMMLHAAFRAERGVVSTPGLRVHQQAILVNAQRKERKNRPTPRLGCSEVGPCEVGSRKGHCRTIPCKLLCCAVLGR